MQQIIIIVQAIDAGKYVCATFLDLRKAFDSLDHHLLLERLSELGSVVLNFSGFLTISAIAGSG